MISRRREPAVFRRIADVIAGQISSGDLAPGDQVPSADLICRVYGVGMATANRTLDLLKEQGLIDAVPGRPSRVRALPVRETVWPEPGALVTWRMPTAAEADPETGMGIPPGVPVAVVELNGEVPVVYPGDRFEIRIPVPAPKKIRPADREI